VRARRVAEEYLIPLTIWDCNPDQDLTLADCLMLDYPARHNDQLDGSSNFLILTNHSFTMPVNLIFKLLDDNEHLSGTVGLPWLRTA
jgi:hypothetical protein